MSQPGNSPQLPGPPTNSFPTLNSSPGVYSVPLKPCCGLLAGDWCDCAEFFTEMVEAFKSPLCISWTPDKARGGRVEVTQP